MGFTFSALSMSKPKSPINATRLSSIMERLGTRPPYTDTDALISNACNKVIEDECKSKIDKEMVKARTEDRSHDVKWQRGQIEAQFL